MKEIMYKILWATIEDYVGLWEILWELNSLLPQNDQDENKRIAVNILLYFFNKNLIVFYECRWGTDEFLNLCLNEILKNLKNEKYWNAPKLGENCIRISSTKKGERFYNKGLIS